MHSNNKLHGFTSVIIYGKELAKLKWASLGNADENRNTWDSIGSGRAKSGISLHSCTLFPSTSNTRTHPSQLTMV